MARAASTLPDRGPRSQILSPLVRKLAAEHGLDLATIAGSGTGGRITKKDVEAAIDSGAPAAIGAGTPASPAAAPALTPVPSPTAAGVGEELVPMTHIRKAIAQHMVASLQTSARAWTMVEVNVDRLVKLRQRAKDAFFERHGVKLTYLPLVTRATTEALLEFPMVNAELRGEELVVRKYVHMGIAVSYDQGLIVPVVRNADAMNVPGLARAIADLAARARSHSLQPDEVVGATYTITNPGPYGSLLSVPIINQPNAGILSLDAIQKRPVVVEDAIAIRSMVYISMSWDHRVVDGELATRFLARVKQNLETWDFAEDLGV
jgi:pyruvate dehydrogenase E2 component (dihydrolipoamide acetyltransferase)